MLKTGGTTWESIHHSASDSFESEIIEYDSDLEIISHEKDNQTSNVMNKTDEEHENENDVNDKIRYNCPKHDKNWNRKRWRW